MQVVPQTQQREEVARRVGEPRMQAIGLLALLLALQENPTAGLLATAFLIGWVLYSWIANIIIMREK